MRNLVRLCAAVVPALALCLALTSTNLFSSWAASAPAPVSSIITVNSLSDAAANDGLCTLREAITSANTDTASGAASGECAAGSGADTITFNVTGTINLTGALPDITSNMTINGPGASQLTVRRDTGGNYRIFTVPSGATAHISGLTVSNGRTPDGLGAFSDAGNGGGVFNAGTLTLFGVAVSGNLTGNGVPTNSTSAPWRGGDGGGIFNQGTLYLIGVTVAANQTGTSSVFSLGGGRPRGGVGAGIANLGALTLTNSTVSGNQTGVGVISPTESGDAGEGGGIANAGTMTLVNSTVTLNRSGTAINSGRGDGINNDPLFYLPPGTAHVGNTILAGNFTTDASGPVTSQGHNVIQETRGTATITGNTATDIMGQDAKLGPLADNGGPTLTHALLAGSPALDAGSNALAVDASNHPLTTDQRGAGFADAADADTTQTVDIGAFEAHPSVEDIADKTTGKDAPLSFPFNVGDAALGLSSVTASSSNATLVPNDAMHISVTGSGSTRTLQLTPATGLTGTSTITVTATGTNGRSMSDTFVLTVVPVNQAPTLNALGDLTINEDAGTQTVNLGGISAGAGETQALTVTASSSDTTLIPTPSVTYTSPSATGSISFAPIANKNGGPVIITITVMDDGGTANGGVNTFSRTFQVTVSAVNDAPVNAVPSAQTVIENGTLTFSAANSNAVSVSDIDAGSDAIKVTLTATHGTVTLGATGGLTFVTGDGTDDASMSFTGTIANVNLALAGLAYKPDAGYSGAASVQIITDDQGHNGSGGALSDTDSVSINVLEGGTLQLSAATYQRPEGGLLTTVMVTRTGGSAGAASVNYATSAGTANGGPACGAGVDFINTSGTLNWNDGETAGKTFTILFCDDASHESDETFNIMLSGAGGSGSLGTPAAAVLTIQDDDPVGGLIQFTQSSYSVAEFAGSTTITVRRSSDTSQAVSVDYATDDGSIPSVTVPCASTTGLALDRCDYTKALGTLHFAAGETEKTFQVLISDDSFDEGPETTTLRLSNPTGGAVLSTQTATLQITDDFDEAAGNVIDDDTKFVRQHYHDFLNREPDADGLAFWKSQITSCGADAQCREVRRINVSAAFFLSIEFQETGYFVERTYKSAYGDATSSGVPGTVPVIRLNEFLPDTQRIGQNVVVGATNWEAQLEANKQAYVLEFVQRPRFITAFPLSMTAAQFVDQLEQNAGITLTPLERSQLRAVLGSTPEDASRRAQVVRAVAENQQLRQSEFNRAFVLAEYFGYLRRNPDDAPEAGLNYGGWKFWLGKLEEFNGDYIRAEMVKAFISSDEYRHRFGQ